MPESIPRGCPTGKIRHRLRPSTALFPVVLVGAQKMAYRGDAAIQRTTGECAGQMGALLVLKVILRIRIDGSR
jgi:hypothetical protein